MSEKQLHFHQEALSKVLRGATALVEAMKVTLGPRSKSILIGKKWGTPWVCNDGVSIAKEVELKDPEENLGVQMMREVARKTGDAVGDGTTTSTLLAHAIFSESLKNIAAGSSAVNLKRGLDEGLKIILQKLKEFSRPVKSQIEVEQVATIAAHNDVILGRMVANAIEKVGADGAVTVEESRGTETTVEAVEGLRFDQGYLSSYFVTDSEKMEAALENCSVLICDMQISTLKDLVGILEQCANANRPLAIIAEDVQGEALATLVVNKLRGLLKCLAVKAPGFGDQRKENLRDLAVLCGATFVSEETGMKLENISMEDLGEVKRIVSNKDSTTVVGGMGEKKEILSRIQQIRQSLEHANTSYDRERLTERLAKILGGVAVIRVGAPTETEIKAKKEALDDSINATKAAVQEGIVPGGGLILIRLAQELEGIEKEYNGEERTGMEILRHALEVPARQIARNSNADDGVVVAEMKKSAGNVGFDAATGTYVDLIEAGIIDPSKVIRTALENAVSVAGTLILSEGTLVELSDNEKTISSDSRLPA